MSSVQSHIAQPKTRKFVVTQDSNQGEGGAKVFSRSDIDAWYAANTSNVTKVSESMYIVTYSGNINDILYAGNGPSGLNYSTTFSDRKTLTDMGATVYIGNTAQSELLVLRLVQAYAPAADGNSVASTDYNGYVVVENNTEELAPNNAGRFCVNVARV